MMDTYLKSKNLAPLKELGGFVVNMIEPMQGQSATQVVVMDECVIPAQPAKGDPAYWYTCVRAPFALLPYADIEACSEEEGRLVCGVWA